MPVDTYTVRCPHCGSPLVVQRAAPSDPQLRVACTGCEASHVLDAKVMETLTVARPAAARAPLRLVA